MQQKIQSLYCYRCVFLSPLFFGSCVQPVKKTIWLKWVQTVSNGFKLKQIHMRTQSTDFFLVFLFAQTSSHADKKYILVFWFFYLPFFAIRTQQVENSIWVQCTQNSRKCDKKCQVYTDVVAFSVIAKNCIQPLKKPIWLKWVQTGSN